MGKINITDRKELITAWIEKKIKPADLAKHFGKSPSYWYNYMHRVRQSPALRPSATEKQVSATIEEVGEIIHSEHKLDSQQTQLEAIPSKKVASIITSKASTSPVRRGGGSKASTPFSQVWIANLS